MAPEHVFVPLAEGPWWTVSANDGFEDLADGGGIGCWPGKKGYQDARDRDPSGRVLVALRYARNLCGHQLALVALEDGLRLPFGFPVAFGRFFRWRPAAQLPAPGSQAPKGSEAMRQVYDELLAGRPAEAAVESAARWFAQAEKLAGL